MEKFKCKLKVLFIFSIILSICFTSLFSTTAFAESHITELSEKDNKILSYYIEAAMEDDFKDNEVWVILKSAYKDLKEIGFSDFKIVEKVSHISSIWYCLEEIHSESEKLTLLDRTNHMFKLTLEKAGKENVLAAINLLKTLDMVLLAQPTYIYETIATGTQSVSDGHDTDWGLRGTYGINIDKAWEITRGSSDIKIGIMEGDVDVNHSDLSGRISAGNLAPNANPDDVNHGTRVAGIIGSKQYDTGFSGIAECDMYLLDSSYDNFVKTIEYANTHGIKIINASVGYRYGSASGVYYRPYDSSHYNALSEYNGLFVAGAGNDNNNNNDNPLYPASYKLSNVISVGAINPDGDKWEDSNYGSTTVDLFAPGGNIYSMIGNNGYGYDSGTSYAVPYVTGVAALIYAKHPFIAAKEVKGIIRDNVTKDSRLTNYCVSGGRLNAEQAVKNAKVHTESYVFYNERKHSVICAYCDLFIRYDPHNLFPYGFKMQRCEPCHYIVLDGGIGQIYKEKEDLLNE